MKKELLTFVPVAEAIGKLLYPHAEVVIHDLVTGKIAYLVNNFSQREEGDSSLIEESYPLEEFPNVFPPYVKMNWDGRRLKSTSATIRNEKGEAVGLLCINLDISMFDRMQELITQFTKGAVSEGQPNVLFEEDWREKVTVYIHSYLMDRGLSIGSLKKEERLRLIGTLEKEGAFKPAKAAEFIANVLGISRATLYNELGKIRKG